MFKNLNYEPEDETILVEICSGRPHDDYDDRFIDDGYDEFGNPVHDD